MTPTISGAAAPAAAVATPTPARQALYDQLLDWYGGTPADLAGWPTATLTAMVQSRAQGDPCPACGHWVSPAQWATSCAYVPWGDRAHRTCLQAGLALDTPTDGWLVVKATAQMPDYLGGTSRLRQLIGKPDGSPAYALVSAADHDLAWQSARFASGLLGGTTIFATQAAALREARLLAAF